MGLIWSENPSLQISAVAETEWIMEDGIFIWGEKKRRITHMQILKTYVRFDQLVDNQLFANNLHKQDFLPLRKTNTLLYI